jgi:hypothetical protein
MVQSKLGNNWVYIDAGDPTIPTSETSQGVSDIGLGITFYKKNQYYVGLVFNSLKWWLIWTISTSKLHVTIYVMGG